MADTPEPQSKPDASAPSPRVRFALRLRELRQARGFAKARHFAHALGIRENRYTRYERGVSEPEIELIYAFCEKLRVTPNELFGVAELPATPGFSSTPQATLEGSPAGVEPRQPRAARADTALVTDRRGEADAAAWHLASIVLHRREATQANQAGQPRPPLATLAETALLYRDLRSAPYDTVARLLTEINPATLTKAAAAEIEAAVDRYVKLLG